MPRRFHRRRSRSSGTMPRRRRSYPRYSRFRGRLKDKTIPLSYLGAALVPIAGILNGDPLVGTGGVMKELATGDIGKILNETANCVVAETTGYQPWSGNWQWSILARNIGLVVAAVVAHKLARPINAKIKNIPFVGKYVSI